MGICATIRTENYQEIVQANQEADCIEFSLNLFQPKHLKELRNLCWKPVIFKMEEWDPAVLASSPDYIDLPHTTSDTIFNQIHPNIKRICSYHDFEKTENLEEVFALISQKPAEVYKIATMAQSSVDALKMLYFLKQQRSKSLIGVCMGLEGAITRILGRVLGSLWTYAPLSYNQQTAPGQIILEELVNLYRVRNHNVNTAIYALVGDPIDKSQGHMIHNLIFKKLGLDALYVKIRIASSELEEAFSLLCQLGFKGLSVTMPLKERVGQFINCCHDQVINTVDIASERSQGWNTDGVGALNALEKRGKVRGKKIVLLGAGGTGWAIAHEAKKRGALVTILNRTLKRAERLAEAVHGRGWPISDFGRISQEGYDILINSTCVGMGEDQRLPVRSDLLLKNRLVMDVISLPRMTPLLIASRERGCKIVQGIEMFIEQAAKQYEYWFK